MNVERIVRVRMLSSQVADPPQLVARVDDSPEKREERQRRAVGAIGGVHKAPHSRKANITDVTPACLHTLIDVYHNTVVQSATGLAVFLHLDYRDESITVRSERNDDAVRVTITVRTGEDLLVRISRWTPIESVLINGQRRAGCPIFCQGLRPLSGLCSSRGDRYRRV